MLVNIHALRAGQIATLRLDDVDNAARTLRISPVRRLDTLTLAYLTGMAGIPPTAVARSCATHLLVNQQTAGGVEHVATEYVTRAFRKLGMAHQLWVDRFLDEVHNTGGYRVPTCAAACSA